MAYQPKSYRKFVATAATATLVATAVTPAFAADFEDVSSTYKNAVDYLVDNNIAKGTSETTFGTTASITRGDAAVMIANVLELDTATAPASSFTDLNSRVKGAVNALFAEKIISGKTSTEFKPNDNITRQEMAKILTLAYNLEAGDTKNTFTDVNSNWDAYVDALVENEITLGKTSEIFAPTQNVTRGEFALFMYRAKDFLTAPELTVSGVTATTANRVTTVNATVANAEADAQAKIEVFANGSTTAVATKTVNVADGKVTTDFPDLPAGNHTVKVTVGEKSAQASFTVAAFDLAINSVTAIDAGHVQVAFNKPVLDGTGANSAETVSNYGITGGLTVTKAELSKDKKSAVLTLSAPLTKNTAYTVTVKKNLQDAEGKALSTKNDFTTGLYFADEVKPTVSAVASENGNVKITFSENLGSTVPTVVINGVSVTASAPVNNTVTVTKANLAVANLENAKSYPVIVSGATDLAGNTMDLYNNTFTYSLVTDAIAPQVTNVKAESENKITVSFSEEIAGITSVQKDGLTDVKSAIGLSVRKDGALVSSGLKATTKDGVNFTIDLSGTTPNAIFDSAKNETSVNLDVTFAGYKDLGNNVGTSVTRTVPLTKDVTAPTLVKSEYDAVNKNFILTFSEELAADTSANLSADLTVIDNSTGQTKVVPNTAVLAVAAGDKKVTVSNATVGGLNLANGDYTFNFAKGAFSDQALNKVNTSAAISTKVTVIGDASVKPAIIGNPVVTGDTLTVTYDADVKGGTVAGSATDVANYKLDGQALPSGTVITLDGASRVATIKMPAGSVEKTHVGILTVSNVQGKNGATIDTVDKTVSLTDTKAPTLLSAKVGTDGKITLTFSENVDGKQDGASVTGGQELAPDANDFVVAVNGTTATGIAVEKGSSEDQIVITSSSVSFATGTITVKTAPVTSGKDAAGNLLATDVLVSATR
ncbi:S-layer homology domain-containing protein [Domibacillus indicus]|uniref:S-layer homology domain-containing protein n=1 Tax=Domibacillus indicus TaxID=1437523 RepID=UPI000617CD30|nr:S-layer homology domain-containing protein [Domibacillus indicus]